MTKEMPDTDTVNAFEEIPDADSVKALNAEVVDDFRANAGKLGGQFEGALYCCLPRPARNPDSHASARCPLFELQRV
jgi:hypothetical protein